MSDWFDRVTGTNDYERQSWRDSYNGGQAAGDLTGNTNARLSEERESFQGATWSGSSSQPSALELAQSYVGSGRGTVRTGSGSTGTGAGNGAVAQVAPRRSSGGNLTFAGTGSGLPGAVSAPLKTALKDEITGIMIGGDWYQPNPWFSDGEAWEQRAAEPGEWLGGMTVIGADAVYSTGRFLDWGFDMDIVSNKRQDKPSPITQWSQGDGAWGDIASGFTRQEARVRQSLERLLGTGKVVPVGGF